MTTVNMLDAKTNLSRLVEQVESGATPEIIIARNGRPAARLVPVADKPKGQRIGIAKGKFEAPADFDALNPEILTLFGLDDEPA